MPDVIRTVEQLDETGRFAWPGAYLLLFYPVDEHGDGGGVDLS